MPETTCAWHDPKPGVPGLSHTICSDCEAQYFPEPEPVRVFIPGEYLG